MGVSFLIPEMVEIATLKAAQYNPRKISDWEMRKLMTSIETDGFIEPIVINKDGTIIGGHQRVEALKNIGEPKVSAIRLDLSKERERELNLRLNRVSGEWDVPMLVAILKDMDEGERMRTGFDENEIAKLCDEDLKRIEQTMEEEGTSGGNSDVCEACGRKMPKGKKSAEQIED